MTIDRTIIALAVLGLSTQPLVAQQRGCSTGPGAAFGVTAYQCASCSYKLQAPDTSRAEARRVATQILNRPTFGFQAEPVVLETTSNSLLKPGDVIESVNSSPITTRTGSDLFTYPTEGEFVIRVRRAGTSMEIATRASSPCLSGPKLATIVIPTDKIRLAPIKITPDSLRVSHDSIRGRYAAALAGRRGLRAAGFGSDTQVLLDELRITVDRRFGFAVSCKPGCTRTRAPDGAEYYKFDGYPPIIAIVKGGVAEVAGLREGDEIVEVDGLSILEEAGALGLMRSSQKESLRVRALRNGQRVEVVLTVRPGNRE